jgi:hypothetical protein
MTPVQAAFAVVNKVCALLISYVPNTYYVSIYPLKALRNKSVYSFVL